MQGQLVRSVGFKGSSKSFLSTFLLFFIFISLHPSLCLYLIFLSLSFFKIYLFYFWLHWVFVAARGLSLVAASGGYSSLWYAGFSLQWLLLLRSMGSRHVGFSSCGTQAQKLWRKGLVAPQHVGFSQTRARTYVPCIGRRILNHCATRKVPISLISLFILSFFHFLK